MCVCVLFIYQRLSITVSFDDHLWTTHSSVEGSPPHYTKQHGLIADEVVVDPLAACTQTHSDQRLEGLTDSGLK